MNNRRVNLIVLFFQGCAVFWCCPCSMYNVYKRADEDCFSCCWPMTLWSLRTKIRTLFRIRVCSRFRTHVRRIILLFSIGFSMCRLSCCLLLSMLYINANASRINSTRTIGKRERERTTFYNDDDDDIDNNTKKERK